MLARLRALGRLASLYRAVEFAHGIALDQSLASLHQVEDQIRSRQAMVMELSIAGNEALRLGDREEWLLDRSQINATQWHAKALEEGRRKREFAMREAAAVYQASRMQLEQLESVLAEARAQALLERDRAEQRDADDRYVSRQRWEHWTNEHERSYTQSTEELDESDQPASPVNLS